MQNEATLCFTSPGCWFQMTVVWSVLQTGWLLSFFFFSPSSSLLCSSLLYCSGTWRHHAPDCGPTQALGHGTLIFFFWDALSAVSACFCLRRFFTVTKWPTQWAASGPEPLMFQTVTAVAEVRLHHQKSLVFFAMMSKCVSLLFVLLRFCPSATLVVGA